MTTFFVWVGLMVAVIMVFLWSSRKSRHIDNHSEDVASSALPAIGAIAEKQHTLRFGRPPTNTPGPPGTSEWYPPTKRRHRHP